MNIIEEKREKNWAKRHRFIITVLLVLSISLPFFNWTDIQLTLKGYEKDQRKSLLQLNAQEIEEYLNLDKILDFSVWDTMQNDHHYYDYILLEDTIQEKAAIIEIVDTVYDEYRSYLIEHGYTIETIRLLMKQLDLSDFAILKKEELAWNDIQPYIDKNGCIVEDIPKYIASSLPPLEAIMSVSYACIDSSSPQNNDRNYYIEDPNDTSILIKNGFFVSENYIPDDLVSIHLPGAETDIDYQLRKDAAKALEEMAEDAAKEHLSLVLVSAYRSFSAQQEIYDAYFSMYDASTAASLVALPGSSEHQLGLSVDLSSQSVINAQVATFGETAEYQWIIQNAHKYGYILRYPADKTAITGTAYEPWHFRYVGVELAEKLYTENLTLEEYTLKNGFYYPVSLLR